jgi:hypothetical protein
MKRLVLAIVLVGGLFSASVVARATSHHLGAVGLWVCGLARVSQPATITLACGDGGVQLYSLRWSHWGESTATATGTYNWNDCTPDCAGGTWHQRPIRVEATRLDNGDYRELRSLSGDLYAGSSVVSLGPPASR